jgi:Zn-dependent protease
MALGWALLFKLALSIPENAYTLAMLRMADAGVQINAVLMLLNLLPIPPLDGGRIAVSLLPYPLSLRFAQLERYGFPILLLLLFSGALGFILMPLVAFFRALLAVFFQF